MKLKIKLKDIFDADTRRIDVIVLILLLFFSLIDKDSAIFAGLGYVFFRGKKV